MTAAPAAPAPARRLVRRGDGLLGGVAGGIAEHLGVPLRVVRFAFLVLTAGSGLGAVLYAVFWIVLPGRPRAAGGPRKAVGAAGAGHQAGVKGVSAWRLLPLGELFVPSVLAALGAALIWRQATEVQRAQWWQTSRESLVAHPDERAGRLRLGLGAALVVLGAVIVLVRTDPAAIGNGLVAVAVSVVGLALITGPWWMRLVGDLGAERRERVRSQERAELAAKVHDSVLQTLALIQRNAEDPRTVSRLARTQERQLRGLLFGAPPGGSVAAAVAEMAAAVEDDYGVTVDAVVVGDAPLDERLAALVGAAGEATTNAAKHAGVTTVSVYAEVEPDAVSVYVKDRGAGFDPASMPADRLGVRRSIVGRVERHGGEATIRTAPGGGTEVELRMPRP